MNWSTEAPVGTDLGLMSHDEANEVVGAAGFDPLPRGTLNLLYRSVGKRVQALLAMDARQLALQYGVGKKRFEEIDRWRSNLLQVTMPDAEPMSTAERVVVNVFRRKEPELAATETAELLRVVRDGNMTAHLRELLLELALLVPPRLGGATRQWLLEVARG